MRHILVSFIVLSFLVFFAGCPQKKKSEPAPQQNYYPVTIEERPLDPAAKPDVKPDVKPNPQPKPEPPKKPDPDRRRPFRPFRPHDGNGGG